MEKKSVLMIGGILALFAVAAIVLFLILGNKSNDKPSKTPEYSWEAKDSSEPCSKECGGGKKYRDVFCVDVNGNPVDDNMCDESEKPDEQEDCNTEPCPWTIGEWSKCSKPCGEGIQTRTVTCSEEGLCGKDKPHTTKVCNLGKCSWKTSPWRSSESSQYKLMISDESKNNVYYFTYTGITKNEDDAALFVEKDGYFVLPSDTQKTLSCVDCIKTDGSGSIKMSTDFNKDRRIKIDNGIYVADISNTFKGMTGTVFYDKSKSNFGINTFPSSSYSKIICFAQKIEA